MRWLGLFVCMTLVAGCATLSPSTQLSVNVREGKYADAKAVVDKNAPGLNMCNLLLDSIMYKRS